MFPTPHIVLQAALFVFGLVWLAEMRRRWRGDLEERRAAEDGVTRLAIAMPWLATAGVLVFEVGFVATLVVRFVDA